jgi:hypothetical protein
MPISVKPTPADIAIARGVARHTRPPADTVAKIMTWGADEKILCNLALGWWLFCRGQPTQRRRNSDLLLLTSITASLLPHLLKKLFNQTRPDRLNGKRPSAGRASVRPCERRVSIGSRAAYRRPSLGGDEVAGPATGRCLDGWRGTLFNTDRVAGPLDQRRGSWPHPRSRH